MFLGPKGRGVDGEGNEYWSLVGTHLTRKVPHQRVVANLGRTPGLDTLRQRLWAGRDPLLEGSAPAALRISLPSATFAPPDSKSNLVSM